MAHVNLREGFTTGTAATAACMAALTLLRTHTPPTQMSVPLPPITLLASPPWARARAWIDIKIAWAHFGATPQSASACVVKDAGDDPDQTNHAQIWATVQCSHAPCPAPFAEAETYIHIHGGPGIGKVTLPGLAIPVGDWAINPVPRMQIRYGLWSCMQRDLCPVTCFLSVPNGSEIAKHTFNPRLGIVGGISILGTQGIVKPYSNAAYRATIAEQISVARALGCTEIFLATGRRSEKALMARYPTARQQAFVPVADNIGYALGQCAGMRHIVLGLFIGKLVKFAQGHTSTHAHTSTLDIDALARLSTAHGVRAQITHALTARHALELLARDPHGEDVIRALLACALARAEGIARSPVTIHLFDLTTGALLATS